MKDSVPGTRGKSFERRIKGSKIGREWNRSYSGVLKGRTVTLTYFLDGWQAGLLSASEPPARKRARRLAWLLWCLANLSPT